MSPPQNFSKKVILAFPSGDAATETIETFRKNYPEGFPYTTPKGPRALRLKPLRDGETNKQLTLMGKIRSELESVVKNVPQLVGWKVDSSVGNGYVFITNEETGDALKLFCVQKPASVFEQPKVIDFACHFEQIGLSGKRDEIVKKANEQLRL